MLWNDSTFERRDAPLLAILQDLDKRDDVRSRYVGDGVPPVAGIFSSFPVFHNVEGVEGHNSGLCIISY
jgi:hypothetical protein